MEGTRAHHFDYAALQEKEKKEKSVPPTDNAVPAKQLLPSLFFCVCVRRSFFWLVKRNGKKKHINVYHIHIKKKKGKKKMGNSYYEKEKCQMKKKKVGGLGGAEMLAHFFFFFARWSSKSIK